MKNNYKSRFKILKGGKISLVVSALITTIATSSFAATQIIGQNESLTVDTISSDGENAISITGPNSTLIVNGSITSTNLTSSQGSIHISDSVMSFNITNNGTISSNSSGIIGSSYGGDINITNSKNGVIESNIGINLIEKEDTSLKSGNIKNEGTITSSEIGIYVNTIIADEDKLVLISNSGEINSENKGIEVYNSYSSIVENSGNIKSKNIGITSEFFAASKIINTGDILTTNTGINTTNSVESKIINSGNITTTGIDSNAININTLVNYDSEAGISNSGTITSSGNGIYIENTSGDFGEGIIESKGASILNSGTISAGKYAIKINNNGFNNTKITNESSAVINGNIHAYGGSDNLLTNKGKINLGLNETKSNPTEYELVTNNFTQTKDGKIQIKVDNSVDANAPKYSQIFVNENLTLEDGTTIDFNVVKNPNEKLLAGQTLQNVFLVDISTTTNYNIDKLNITDNSALLNFEAVENSSYGLDFNIVEGKSIADATTPNESNSSDAAKVLDKLKDSGNNLGGFISALNSKSTDKQVAQAVKETTPVIAASIAGSTNQVQQTIGSVISGRQLGIRGIGTPSGANSGDFLQGNYSAWSKVFGAKAKQDDKDGFDGYSFDSYGVAFGADKEFGENKRFGLAFVYANGDVDTNNVEQSSSLDIYNLVAYGSTPILDKDTVFFYQLSLGLQDTQTSRKENTTNSTAKADFNGYLASASARVIRNIQINDNLLVVPTVKAMYSYIKNPSYSETGAGALNLNIDKLSTDSFKVGLGADLEYKLKDGYTLLSNAMLHYDIEQASNVSTSSYSGNSSLSFTTKGMENDKLSYEAGVGIKKSINEDTDFRFEYNYEGRDSTFSNQTISAKLSWKF